jgi:hypothetical protein
MNLKDILLELVSNLVVKVRLQNETIDIPVKMYYKLKNCKIVECWKNCIEGVKTLTLYIDADDYINEVQIIGNDLPPFKHYDLY